ncbi:MAG TPA: GAF domain-containing sensor histidine kinase [Actinomycetota bacterium]|nr:GAF domain-containing sensor histidine kinase [Actinomycetota bacterium]
MAEGDGRKDLLIEAGLALASELSLPAVLQRIVELAVRVTGARYGALGVLGPGGQISEFHTEGVTQEQRRAIGHIPVGRGILGVLIREAEPLRLHDIKEDPRSVGFPPNHPPMQLFLGAPVKARGRVFGNIYLTREPGARDFTPEDEEALVVLASQAGVAVENARLYDEAQQRERRLEAVREIATAILAGIQPETILDLVAGRARELVGADLATLATPGLEPGTLVIDVADGEHAEELRGTVFPRDESVSGEVIASGEPVVLEDAAKDGRAFQPVVKLGEMGPAMFVPLIVRGSAFGTLAVANRAGGRLFGQEDLAFIQTFAGQAAVALEYGRAQRDLQRLAVMDDRERIAKELHDGVIQSLFAVGMGLQATSTISRDPDLQRRIESAVEEMDRVIRDLRNYIFGLRPGILADRQLDQALRGLAEDFQEKTGVVAVVDVDPRIAAELSSRAGDIVQVVREALSNVGRHAQAATCRIALRRENGRAVVEIDDDGTGFDVEWARGRGLGLGNLHERAKTLGADLTVDSALGSGTTVRLSISLSSGA